MSREMSYSPEQVQEVCDRAFYEMSHEQATKVCGMLTAYAATLRQQAARVDEGLRPALERLVESASLMLAEIDTCGHEVDPAYRLHLYEAWEQGKAAIAQQGKEQAAALWIEFTNDGHHIRLWTRHEGQAREEIREGRKMQAFYTSPAALEAALSAQPAERQGEAVGYCHPNDAEKMAARKADPRHNFTGVEVWNRQSEFYSVPLYLRPAAPVGVPDGDAAIGRAYKRWYAAAKGFRNVVADAAHAMILSEAERIAAAPSAPQGVER